MFQLDKTLTNKELVSVVITCYKLAHYLGAAIESILQQSYPHYEIIVVDDGSPDNTGEVAARYSEVRYIRQENLGLSAARNNGLRAARGEYIIFVDADDCLLPRALEAGVACLRAHPECAFAVGQHEMIDADGTLIERDSHRFVEKDHYVELLINNYIWLPATVMYRRVIFDKVGGFEKYFFPAEDYQLCLRIARDFPIRCHREVVAQYRQHDSNQSKNPERMLKAVMSAYRSQWKRIKGNVRFEQAYQTGIKQSRDYYEYLLIGEVSRRVRNGNLRGASSGALTLLRYSPQTFARLTARRLLRSISFGR